ncbi:uncharacterized protein BDZ99DRAFT_464387 [Mytilinidion resinicola]|uniref:Uncharacterized protein n=1 Tax=Mytilinidion resinicola TaxID=574789 RepID=A0A6A6YIA5_9PEZI|nr:uncharacterized protein BDZ99DRAFT_464387 [Mytilinidion resinicola]KAF2808520.1 hypothetical protein BDZ99DRAFT_464387 [Mytilinidion resinicola]
MSKACAWPPNVAVQSKGCPSVASRSKDCTWPTNVDRKNKASKRINVVRFKEGSR